MKILFIGPYRQLDEWGRKSRAVLKTLKKTGYDITCRPIFLSSNIHYDSYIEDAEFVKSDHYDILIQFLLEPYATYHGNIKKRIAIFNDDTIPYRRTLSNVTSTLLMDEIWTESFKVKNSLETILHQYNSNVKVKTVSPTLDLDGLTDNVNKSIRTPDLQNRFIFYYIGNPLDDKDGFKETFLAYANTFTNKDLVTLLVVLEHTMPEDQITQRLEECASVIDAFKPRTQQPDVRVIGPQQGILNTEERVSIHKDGDCMVAPSYSMSASSIVLEAALYKSTPIVNKGNASYECLGQENIWGIESYEEICIYKDSPLRYRFTCGELWHKPIIKSLANIMHTCYINKLKRDKKQKANTKVREYFQNLSYKDILHEGIE